jgi:hypothetical protein
MANKSTLQANNVQRDAENPNRAEGFIVGARGCLVAVLGLFCLLRIAQIAAAARPSEGASDMVAGTFLLAWGLSAVARGAMMAFRSGALRHLPSSLAKNLVPGTADKYVAYTPQTLYQLLVNHRYVERRVPSTLMARALFSVFPNLLYLIDPMRSAVENLANTLAGTLVGFLSFCLGWFSISVGVAPSSKAVSFHILVLILLVFTLGQWLRQANLSGRLRISGSPSAKDIAIFLGLAAGIPLLFLLLPFSGPEGKLFSSVPTFFATTVGLALTTAAAAAYLVRSRVSDGPPQLSSSSFGRDLQENLHPAEFFNQLKLMNVGFNSSAPFRVYKTVDTAQLSRTNAEIHEAILQETEPLLVKLGRHPHLDRARVFASVAGEGMIFSAAVLLFIAVLQSATVPLFSLFTNYIAYAILLWIFGSRISALAHLFWSEVLFKSAMIYYDAVGAFRESQITAGAAYADSIRSENTVAHSKLHFSAFVACAYSATLADYGDGPLDHFRYVLTTKEAPEISLDIAQKLETFLSSRKIIVGPGMADADAVISMHKINAAAAIARNSTGEAEPFRIREPGK